MVPSILDIYTFSDSMFSYNEHPGETSNSTCPNSHRYIDQYVVITISMFMILAGPLAFGNFAP